MAKILKDKSFRLSIVLTFIFFGTGIAFLFLGLADGFVLTGLREPSRDTNFATS